ncbi:hypothetical protein ADUPG1_009208 [Aduncisulcus paluster]|uniref:Amino acid transporter transmembrane domain-containing protein n=1 Tax=Aduncisulcus paluster TaxID=2918883 RepID=A0ABQ5KUS0_9EUKA|nr:hypothetical protein ADUPG1_009208 [Aduncisulcus paluster]
MYSRSPSVSPLDDARQTYFPISDSRGASPQLTMSPSPAVRRSLLVKSSVLASTFNLSNSITGSGILSLPYAFKLTGLVLGIIILLVVALSSMFTYDVLIVASEFTGATSYRGVAERLYGKNIGLLAEIFVGFFTLSGLCSFPLIIGDYTTDIVADMFDTSDDPWWSRRRFLIIISCVFILLPLSMAKSIDFLRFSSFFAILCVVICVFIVITYGIQCACGTEPYGSGEIVLFEANIGVARAISLCALSYAAHFNVQRIYLELDERSVPKMRKVLINTAIIVSSLYFSMSISGYSVFRDDTASNILNSFPAGYLAADIARIALFVTLCFSFPLVQFSFRGTIIELFFSKEQKKDQQKDKAGSITVQDLATSTPSVVTSDESKPPLDNQLMPSDDELITSPASEQPVELLGDDEDDISGVPFGEVQEPSLAIKRVISFFIVAFATGVAMLVDDLGILFSIVGSLFGTAVVFVFPGFFLVAIERRRWVQVIGIILIVFGIVCGLLGFISTISDIINGND